MKKKLLSCILAVVMVATLAVGCGSSGSDEASGETEAETSGDGAEETDESGDTTAQLSSADYEFEKNYIFGDFNRHSLNDVPRQGIDTFEDNDIVFVDINYEELIDILESEGNYLIQFSGSWCHNSRAMSNYSNTLAKEYGIDTIYMYDFDFDNGEDGKTFLRMTNGSENVGVQWNYMYGDVITKYLTNMDDWIEFPSDTEAAITYTNAEGKDLTVSRAQEPILVLYNKDNTTDNSGKGADRDKFPVVYAFEKMVDRDEKGVYLVEMDENGEEVLDEDGNQIRNYITDEYIEELRAPFDYMKDNSVEFADYTDEDYFRKHFESLSDADQVNLHVVTYRELVWLLDQDGNSLVLFGGPWDDATQASIASVNDYAVANNAQVYVFDPVLDDGVTAGWGYKNSASILESDSAISYMYTDLIESYLSNLTTSEYDEANADTCVSYTNDAGQEVSVPKAVTPYLFAYNKAATDEDGLEAPVTAYSENGKDILSVFEAYAEGAGIEAVDVQ